MLENFSRIGATGGKTGGCCLIDYGYYFVYFWISKSMLNLKKFETRRSFYYDFIIGGTVEKLWYGSNLMNY